VLIFVLVAEWIGFTSDFIITPFWRLQRSCWMAPNPKQLDVEDYLCEQFGDERVSSLGVLNAWAPRSPDLTPDDFFLWGI
jgi:hypothetical protein